MLLPSTGAQAVPVRSGEHETYSRLVFDWDTSVDYVVRSGASNIVTVTFNQNSALDLARVNLKSLSQINAIEEISTSPLEVRLTLKKGAALKHFKKDNRVVFDAQSAQTKIETTIQPITEAPPQPAVPVAEVKPDAAQQPLPEQKLRAAIQKDQTQPNLFALSSVSPTNMAAFVLHDQIWVINSGKKQLLNPQISGPQKADMGPMQDIQNDQANVFTFKNLQGADILAQGGGLVWRVLVGNNLLAQSAIKPVRLSVLSNQARSGKIIWPFKTAGDLVQITDPITGTLVTVIPVGQSSEYAGKSLDFVDFKTLESPLGLAIWPKVDDLVVRSTDAGVEIYRPAGLALSTSNDVQLAMARKSTPQDASPDNRLYDFQNWQLGGTEALSDNETILLGALPGLVPSGQVENLLNLAKMYLANGMAPEATGFLKMAETQIPDLKNSPAYKAIRGATLVMNRRYEDGFKMLSDEQIKDKEDVLYFRSYALARLQDWQQAEDLLPTQFNLLKTYPAEIATPLALMLSESALRAGDFDRWNQLLEIMDKHAPNMRIPHKAAYDYLRGEAYRQSGNIDSTIDLWSELTNGPDKLYRVRAGLALTRLESEERDLPLSDAVDRLERIRFSWRGDDLEAQVNYWLGRIYFDFQEYVKGLNIMRDAASFATGPHLGQKIIDEMTQEFSTVFLGEELNTLPAPDAAALYDRFSELIPNDETGDQIAVNLALHLAKAGLYDKAIELLTYQLKSRLQGEKAYFVAKELTRIHMLNDQPEEASFILQDAKRLAPKSSGLLDLSDDEKSLILTEAEILSLQNKPEQAIELLESEIASPDFNKLRADIAWKNGFWEDAAQALQDVMDDEMPQGQMDTISQEDAEMILRRAIALNLAGDRIRLANMREKFTAAINKTDSSQIFELITRLRRNGELADRETLLSIVSEVDLYKGILDDNTPEETPAE